MKEVNNLPLELVMFSSLVKERNPGLAYQKAMVSIYLQLKLNMKLKRKLKRKRNIENLTNRKLCNYEKDTSFPILCYLLCSLFVMISTNLDMICA